MTAVTVAQVRNRLGLQWARAGADARVMERAGASGDPDSHAALPPRRLGGILRVARRRAGLGRREAADAVGVSRRMLARGEAGRAVMPDDVLARLADLYGDDLAAMVPRRVPVRVEDAQLVAGGEIRILASRADDDVLGEYVSMISALRGTPPNGKLPIRTSDLEALALALGRDSDDVEERIAEVVGCTAAEASMLHSEMLRRRLLVPVAGAAAGVVALAGASLAAPARVDHRVETRADDAAAEATIGTEPTAFDHTPAAAVGDPVPDPVADPVGTPITAVVPPITSLAPVPPPAPEVAPEPPPAPEPEPVVAPPPVATAPTEEDPVVTVPEGEVFDVFEAPAPDA